MSTVKRWEEISRRLKQSAVNVLYYAHKRPPQAAHGLQIVESGDYAAFSKGKPLQIRRAGRFLIYAVMIMLMGAEGWIVGRLMHRVGIRVPEDVIVIVDSPAEIHVSWSDAGQGFTYNAYSDATGTMKRPWKENRKPLRHPHAVWIPAHGLNAYWMSITAVDPQGRESALSQPVYIKIR